MEEKKMEMIKFNEQEKIDSVNGALALRPQINEIVDEICKNANPTDDNGTIKADEQPVIDSIQITD